MKAVAIGRPTLWSPAPVGAMCALRNDRALTQPAAWTAAVFRPLHVGTVGCNRQGLHTIPPHSSAARVGRPTMFLSKHQAVAMVQ